MSASETAPSRDNRPMVYGEEGKFVYRASSCGSCIKALIAARMGMEPEARSDALERIAEEGNLHEGAVIAYLTNNGFLIEDRQNELEIALPSAVIRGHCDGTATNNSGETLYDYLNRPIEQGRKFLLEIKSMGRSVFDRFLDKGIDDDSFYRYAVQISLYMYKTKLPGMLVAKCRDDGRTVVVLYEKPPIEPRLIIQRMIKVEFAAREGKLPDQCDRKDFFCSYRYLCDRPDSKLATGINEVALNAWAKQYAEAVEMEKKYASIKDAARSNLLQLLNYEPSDLNKDKVAGLKISSGKYIVNAYVAERESVSLDILRKMLGPEIVNPYVSRSRYPVLRVKEKSKDA